MSAGVGAGAGVGACVVLLQGELPTEQRESAIACDRGWTRSTDESVFCVFASVLVCRVCVLTAVVRAVHSTVYAVTRANAD